jgi:hypothetical protein
VVKRVGVREATGTMYLANIPERAYKPLVIACPLGVSKRGAHRKEERVGSVSRRQVAFVRRE